MADPRLKILNNWTCYSGD